MSNREPDDILLSVCMITYNHKPFVSKAIESILAQETNFRFRLIIGDDCSSDGTGRICDAWAQKHPDKIFVLPITKNMGLIQNFKRTIKAAQSRYIAFCEGDDYWTCNSKLQRQVDFLEANPQYGLSCTRYKKRDTNIGKTFGDELEGLFYTNCDGLSFGLAKFFETWITKTLTVVARRSLIDIDIICRYQYYRDTHLFYHILKVAPGYCHNFVSGVYNIHEGGVWSAKSQLQKEQITYKVFKELYSYNKEDQLLKNRHLESTRTLISTKIKLVNYPLFHFSIYSLLLRYFCIIHSFAFLKDQFKEMWQQSFSTENFQSEKNG
ncbi:MAG: glycosyltransferase [Ferruginibacter sp.]|nr:glycosyltransferase [Ferruginibacter sp.]